MSSDFNAILAMVKQAAAAAKVEGGESSNAAEKRPYDSSEEPSYSKKPLSEQSIAERYSSITGQALPESVLNSRVVQFLVPNTQVGRIIGKGGETIHRLIEQAKCHIQVTVDNGGADRNVTLTGTPDHIDQAKFMIYKTLEDFHFIIPHPTSTWEEGDRMLGEVIISQGAKTLLHDLRGEVEAIEQNNNVKIAVRETGKPFRQNCVAVLVTGSKESTPRGLYEFRAFLSRRDTTPLVADSSSSFGDMKTITVKVSKGIVGLVIGKGGETIKRIGSETGAKVQFDQNDMGEELRMCTIQGSTDAALRAEAMVQQIINEASNRQAGIPSVPYGATLVRVSVPADKAGLVIGRGGETVKQISQMSGAKVDFDKTTQDNPVERFFNIVGSADQIQAAQSLINERIQPRQGGSFNSGGSFGGGFSNFGGFSQTAGSSAYEQFAAMSQQWHNPQAQQQAAVDPEEQRRQWEAYYAQMAQYQAYMASQGQQPPQ